MGITGIYKITSPSGSIYIGQSKDMEERWYNHKHPNGNIKSKLQSSLKSHGFKSHSFEVVHGLPVDCSQDTLNIYECFYFSQFFECGFNMLNLRGDFTSMGRHSEETKIVIGEKGRGRKHTEEFKKKIGDAHRGMKRSAETCKNISNSLKGRLLSEESRLKMSLAKKGKKASDETKAKLSKANSGEKNGFFGKKHSQETRDRISKSKKR
jgi:group I intron endonuclease